jgi:hypothetical protein
VLPQHSDKLLTCKGEWCYNNHSTRSTRICVPYTSTEKTKKKNPEETLAEVIQDFDAAWEYCSGSWHSRWENNYALYNNVRVKRGYEGISDTFVPMVFGTIETLTSALFGTKPKFNYLPPAERQDQKTDVLNGLIDFYWDKDQWSIKVISTGRTGLQLGTGVDYWYWDNDHPCMLNVALRDYFRDPTTPGGEEPRFQGRRYLTTKEELESFEVVDLDKLGEDGLPTGEMKKKFSNLAKVAEGGPTGDPTDKEQKDMWYGSTVAEAEKKQIEVIEYWTNDRVISVANRTVVIQDDENPFKAKARANGAKFPKGLMPFNWFRDYVDPSLFYAKGEIDFIGDQQELLNDITNQNNDAITYTLNQMYTLDPKYAHLLNEIENLPGAVYPVEANALMPIQQRSIPPDAFNERQNIKNEIRETTASNEVIKGVGAEGAKTTATEINAQIAGAGQRINLKITQIENEYFHRMAKIVFEMVKLYVNEPMMVRILGKDGARWEEFDPAEFQGDYEPRVQLDISIENKKQQDAANAKELLAAFLGDPDVNQQELKKLVLQRSFELDPDEVELLMQPPMDMMGGLPPEMMGMPPEAPPNPLAGLFPEAPPVPQEMAV